MLLDCGRAGTTAVLIIDEAHNLDWDVLEEVRLLGNLENRRGKLLQIIISGQPELDLKLDAPQFRQLKQRIALRFALQPFTPEETEEYINYRLAHAGLENQKIFSDDVSALINHRANGIPRLINLICDNSMLIAFALNSREVTQSMVDEVCADLKIDAAPVLQDVRRQPVLPGRPLKA
jgi:general secretion pathway protein A